MTLPHQTCLDIAEKEFQRLASGPDPLTIDGSSLPCDLPNQPIPIDELRVTLLKRGCGTSIVNAVWSRLVRLSQTGDDRWIPAVVGMMVPGLKRIGGRLGPCFPGDPADLDSEILAAFLDALRQADPTSPGLPSQLYRAALCGARRTYRNERRAVDHRSPLADACYARAGNPDLALARAVLDGVVTPRQAKLVCGIFLDRDHRVDIARRLGLSRRQVRAQLASARRELAAYLVT